MWEGKTEKNIYPKKKIIIIKIRISLSNSYFLGQTLILGVCNREHRKAIGTRVHNTDLTDTAFSFRWVIGEAYNAWDQMKVKYICKQILGI